MPDALFERNGDVFAPSELAHGPWMSGTLHGGPVCGLVAHAAEQLRPDADFLPVRLVVDMHRPAPMAPIQTLTRLERKSRRMALDSVGLHADGKEVARGTVLFARSSDAPARGAAGHERRMPLGPEGLKTTAIVPKDVALEFPPGFHREAEVRWVEGPNSSSPSGWLRMPMPLVAGEAPTPFERVATISDLGNAVASVTKREGTRPPEAYINPDTTLYLEREATGDWIGLALDSLSETRGVGISEVVIFDEHGPLGRMLSARIHNPIAPEPSATRAPKHT